MNKECIAYLKKRIEQIKFFELLHTINGFILPVFLMTITMLAYKKTIGFDVFLVGFLFSGIVKYFPINMKANLIENVNKSETIKEIQKNCSTFSREELDDALFYISELIEYENIDQIFITKLYLHKSNLKKEENTEEEK